MNHLDMAPSDVTRDQRSSGLASTLRYLRTDLYYYFLRPFSIKNRGRRMQQFAAKMNIKEGMSVIDLGGQPQIWDAVPVNLDVTILNLPGIASGECKSAHSIHYIEGDACDAKELQARSFDTVFSNSVIEHVGDEEKQAAFASEVRRLGKS